MKCVYKFFWDCRRMGDVEGVFIATPEEISNALGKDVYFGEILGKHSEVYGTLDKEDVTLVTDNEIAVNIIEKYSLTSGYNPLDYLNEEEEDDG